MKFIQLCVVFTGCVIVGIGFFPQRLIGEESVNVVADIFSFVEKSDLVRHEFAEVEDATHATAKTVPPPSGYLKGMAISYALLYQSLKSEREDKYLAIMVKEFGGGNDPLRDFNSTDRRDYFDETNGWLSNATEAGRLQNVFAILLELGVRESFGNCYEGIDPNNTGATGQENEAETGLFQTSWNYYLNSKTGRSFLGELKESYETGDRSTSFSLLPVFEESAGKWKGNHGPEESEGWKFQELTKKRPRFAVEFMALCVRSLPRGTHFKEWKDGGSVKEKGYNVFLRDYGFELPPEISDFLKGIEKIVDRYEGEPNEFEPKMGKWFSEAMQD